MKTPNEIKKDLEGILIKNDSRDILDLELLQELTDYIARSDGETEKAYGGCHNCYGKGYSTYRYATTALGDFEGEEDTTTPFEVHMNFCNCDRGKQLKELVTKSNREALEGFREFCANAVPEKRLSDEHYVLISLLMDSYISQLNKLNKGNDNEIN